MTATGRIVDIAMLRRPVVTIAVLGALLATLVALDRALIRDAERERLHSLRLERLVAPEEVAGGVFAVLRLEEMGSGRVFVYGRHDGTWYCLSHFGAVADGRAVEETMASLLEATGVVHSEEPTRAPIYGLDRPGMLRLSIHGPAALTAPDADLLLAFDLGDAVPEAGGTYLRPVGSDRVWSVDAPLRRRLEPPREGLPPLIDPHVIPAIWSGARHGVAAIEVEPASGASFRLERRLDPRDGSGEDRPTPWDWVVRSGGRVEPAHPLLSAFYVGFVLRAPYHAILPAGETAELVREHPGARVRLESATGDGLELVLSHRSSPASPQAVIVASSASRNLFAVSPEVAGLLAPSADRLLDPAQGNPWEAYLRR